jgi:DNA-binding response OmpR family regulator
MTNLQVLIVSDERSNVTAWKEIQNQLELQTNHKPIQDLLISPAAASDYDLVIIDIEDHESAIALCSVVRMDCSGAILLYTNSCSESDLIAGYNAGADDYLVKPRSSRVLQEKVTKWCKRIAHARTVSCT